MEPLRPGDPRTVGPWKVLSRIGAGGMGVVYYANRDGQMVALKVVRDLDGTERNIVQYFKRELANLRLVSGPSVAALVDADMEAAPAWIAFEYIDGPNLKVFVDSNGPLLEDAWRKFAAALLNGISEVHARGVIHRDLKPSNIVIASTGPKLIDFGIAQALDDTPFTRTGVTVGTPTWMAPEQIDAMGVGKPADLFAAGSILLYAATGREPWGTGTKAEMQARICRGRPDLGGLSVIQSRLISALLIKDPIKRATAEDAVRVLGGAIYWSGVPWRTVFYWTSAALVLVVGLLYGYVFSSPISAAPEVTPVVVLAATPPVIAESPSPYPASVEPIVSPKPALNPTPLVAGVPVAVVKVDRLNVRASAAADAQVVFVALRGEMLYVSGDPAGIESGWLPVYSVDIGYGWVAQRHVVREDRPAVGVDYAIWLQHVHSRVNPISVADAGRVHQIALMLPGANAHSAVFTPDGLLLAAGFADGSVKLVGVPNGVVVKTLVGHTKTAQMVALSSDGKTLASGSFDNTIKLWDLASGLESRTLVGHLNPVLSVALSPDGRTMASTAWSPPDSGTANDGVILWNVDTGLELARFEGQGSVNSVAYSPNGKTVLAGGAGDINLAIWDIESRRVVREFPTSLGIWVVAYSPDGGLAVAGSYDGSIAVWDVVTGRAIRTMVGHKDLVHSLDFSPNGKLLVSGSKDKTIRLWEVATGRELRNLAIHSASVFGVTFSPDGTTFASVSADGSIRIWDAVLEAPQYSLLDSDGKHVRWDPCKGAINVSVNYGDMDSQQQKHITEALVRVLSTLSKRSGLQFVYAGATSEVSTGKIRQARGDKSAVLIQFAPTSQVSLFAGANTFRSTSPAQASREWWAIQSAEILMNISDESLYWLNAGMADFYLFQRMFEVVGLNFVASQYEVMGKLINVSQKFRLDEFLKMNLELGSGDILGLRAVGAEQGCIVE